jgi:transcriptional regulator with XRE-family HTH domain
MAQAGIKNMSELARRMKVNRQTVHRWLDGQGDKLTPEMLFKLADALNVNARWIAFGPPETPVKPMVLDPDSAEVVEIKEALDKSGNPEAKDQWLSQGRTLVKILAPTSRANPFSSRENPTKQT